MNNVNKKAILIASGIAAAVLAICIVVVGVVNSVNVAIETAKIIADGRDDSTDYNEEENASNEVEDYSDYDNDNDNDYDYDEDYVDYDLNGADSDSDSSVYEGKVVNLNKMILRDNMYIDSISLYLPDGWNANVKTDYRICAAHPLQSTVEITSDGGDCGIVVLTPFMYLDKVNGDTKSQNYEENSILDYSTCLKYHNASDFTDYYLNSLGYKWIEYESSPVDRAIIDKLEASLQEQAEECLDYAKINYYAEVGVLGNNEATFSLDYEGTMSQKTGIITNGSENLYAKTYCIGGLCGTTIDGAIIGLGARFPFKYQYDYWSHKGVSLYWAVDQETYDENEELAQFLIDNVATTKMYQQVEQQMINEMIPRVKAGQTELANYAQQCIQSVQSGFNETNDRVMQEWDDYLLDQDRYMASDGTEIIVPTTAEYVYYNGDSVVWADNASYEPEAGYEQIN